MKLLKTSALLPLALAAALAAGCAQQSTTPNAAGAAAKVQASDVKRQALAKGLYELAYSPRQNAVFVASSGGFGADASPAKILRLNPQTLAVEREIALERKAFGVTLDDAGGRLYVGNTVDLSVTVVDIVNSRVVGVVQLEEKVKSKDKDGKEIERYAHEGVNKLLVGNKCDLTAKRAVETQAAKVRIDCIDGY